MVLFCLVKDKHEFHNANPSVKGSRKNYIPIFLEEVVRNIPVRKIINARPPWGEGGTLIFLTRFF